MRWLKARALTTLPPRPGSGTSGRVFLSFSGRARRGRPAGTKGSFTEAAEAGAMEAKVRPARAEDKEPLMSFIRQVWGGHDYLPYVWDLVL